MILRIELVLMMIIASAVDMLGLMLVASIGMMGASMRDQVNELVDKTFTADYMVTAPQDMGMSLPQDVPERIGRTSA